MSVLAYNEIHHGDCLELLKDIPDNCVDMVLCDLPYGTTYASWDTIIPFEPMWEQVHRVAKENAALVFTSAQPFTSLLITSNLKNFKYTWVWEKPNAKGHFNAKKRPMQAHEDICVFYRSQPTYNPQMTSGHVRKTTTRDKSVNSELYQKNTKTTSYDSTDRYPRSVQIFSQDTQKSSLHPTQKPVLLFEYLIKTYTNPGDLVLDFVIGSGTTGVAAIQTGRNFLGIEKEEKYIKIAKERTCTKP